MNDYKPFYARARAGARRRAPARARDHLALARST